LIDSLIGKRDQAEWFRDVAVETKKRAPLCKYNIHLIYFNSTEALSTLLTENTYDVIMEHVQGKGRIPKSR